MKRKDSGACRPLVMQITFEDPFAFSSIDAFKDVLEVPRERRADVYADPAWRKRARSGAGGVFSTKWDKTTIAETERHRALMVVAGTVSALCKVTLFVVSPRNRPLPLLLRTHWCRPRFHQ